MLTYTQQIHKMFQDMHNKHNKIIVLSKDQYHIHEDEEESEPKYIQLYGRISRSEGS